MMMLIIAIVLITKSPGRDFRIVVLGFGIDKMFAVVVNWLEVRNDYLFSRTSNES